MEKYVYNYKRYVSICNIEGEMLNLNKFCNLRTEICFGLGVVYLQKHEHRKVDNQRNYSRVFDL